MSLYIASLNSGSSGNCYYIGNNDEAVLVDAGISCREVDKRMQLLGLDPAKLRAVFITHEHTDHISGLSTLVKKYRIPVFITMATHRAAAMPLPAELLRFFNAFEAISIGGLSITGFPKLHDAIDPHSLVISYGGVTVGVFTDIGAPCNNVVHYFKQCHAVFLESNYDEQMLASGRYPYFLKKRITGGKGHLSNRQALQLFLEHRPAFMTHLLLSHLSRENNHPSLAEKLFEQHAHNVIVAHAPRDRHTAVYHIQHVETSPILFTRFVGPANTTKKRAVKEQTQLSLF